MLGMWQRWLCLHARCVARRAVRAEIPSLMRQKTTELQDKVIELEKQLRAVTEHKSDLLLEQMHGAAHGKTRIRKVMANTLQMWVGKMKLHSTVMWYQMIARWRAASVDAIRLAVEKAKEKFGETAAQNEILAAEVKALKKQLTEQASVVIAARTADDGGSPQSGDLLQGSAATVGGTAGTPHSTHGPQSGNGAGRTAGRPGIEANPLLESAACRGAISFLSSILYKRRWMEAAQIFVTWQQVTLEGLAVDAGYDQIDNKTMVMRQALYINRELLTVH